MDVLFNQLAVPLAQAAQAELRRRIPSSAAENAVSPEPSLTHKDEEGADVAAPSSSLVQRMVAGSLHLVADAVETRVARYVESKWRQLRNWLALLVAVAFLVGLLVGRSWPVEPPWPGRC